MAAVSRIELSPPGRRLLLDGLAVVGVVFALAVMIPRGAATDGGVAGQDCWAYWESARRLRAGGELYIAGVGGHAAYLYPPLLVQLFLPLSFLPFTACLWLWRALLFGALTVAVGSPRNAGLALLLFPPVLAEIDSANVHLLLAAATAEAIRGRAGWVVPAALTKYATIVAAPVLWFTACRSLLAGAAGALGIVAVSVALAPGPWVDWARFMMSSPSGGQIGWYELSSFVGWPVRAAACVAAVALAFRWRRMLAVAVTLALPVLWFHGLSVLAAAVATPDRAGWLLARPARAKGATA